MGTLEKELQGNIIASKRIPIEVKPSQPRRRATELPMAVKQRVERLGKLLAHSNAPHAGFGTLRCVGVVRLPHPETTYVFRFDLPEEQFPKTKILNNLLQAIQSRSDVRPMLGERFTMARKLVETMFQLHSVGWLHKSIRRERPFRLQV
jgi:hypothetical protein